MQESGMSLSFLYAVEIVLMLEGGSKFTKNPKDPGGATKYGISLRAYPQLGESGIEELTKDQATMIYKRDYWDKIEGDKLPADVALCVFDAAVNQGAGAAIGMLDDALKMTRDGKIDENNIAKINLSDTSYLIDNFLYLRNMRYLKSDNFEDFGKGWMIRTFKICKLSQNIRLLISAIK